MNVRIIKLCILCLLASSSFAFSSPMSISAAPRNTAVSIEKDSTLSLLLKQTPKQVSLLLGRKLSFKEKVGLKMLKWKIAKIPPDDRVVTRQGKDAQLFGILAVASLIIFPLAAIPLGILAIVKGSRALKDNPNDAAARTGKILGIVSLGILVLAILLLIAFISAFTIE